MKNLFIVLLLALIISGCFTNETKTSSSYQHNSFFSKCFNSYNEQYKGHFKIGKPFIINNVRYIPKYQPFYNEVGMASWYGDKFHCRQTANGEVFNKYQLSAAHNTLPLPSVVKVTNLENSKSVIVIVNDRGPFRKNRIVDLSERAAEIIGMRQKGVARVRVEYLPNHTNALLAKIKLDKFIKRSQTNHNKSVMVNNNKNQKLIPTVEAATLSRTTDDLSSYTDTKILVGQFNNRVEAIKAVKELSNIGFIKISQIFNDKKTIYNVYFAATSFSKLKSEAILRKIIDLGYKQAYFVNH